MTSTTLLGPQRFLTTAGSVVRALDVAGPVAVVLAGWEERESDDGELQEVMGGRVVNLRLHGRMMGLLAADPAVTAAALILRDAMDDLAAVYSTRLHHGVEAVYAVHRSTARPDIVASAFADGLRLVQEIDRWYLHALGQLYGELEATRALEQSEELQRHRAEVAEIVAGAGVLAIAGGHVGVLTRAMRLFAVRPPAELPVVAWSGGAMAVTSQVVLFLDDSPTGFTGAEIWDRGLARVPGVVALPHARRRLRLDDRVRMSVLAGRFPDATCVLLDDGSKVVIGADGQVPAGARVLTADGAVVSIAQPTPAGTAS
ncbi:MAG: hypothetical protein ABI083_16410 [Lapillicoccus sp.]